MRKIKFRAWHVENKTMVNFDNKKVIKDQYQMAHLCELIAGTHEDGFLMQFTGLQDKNGVDIYEGDIVTFTFEETIIGVIKWDDEFAGFEIAEGHEDHCLDFNHAIEIIGNIHQSPELLEQ